MHILISTTTYFRHLSISDLRQLFLPYEFW